MAQAAHLNGIAAGASIQIPINVTASTTSGQIGSLQNPEPQLGNIFPKDVIVQRATLLITQKSSAACTLDIGVASTLTLSDNLMDGVSVAATPANTVYSNLSAPGTNGEPERYMASTDYVTVSVASGNANGLQGTLFVNYALLDGGP